MEIKSQKFGETESSTLIATAGDVQSAISSVETTIQELDTRITTLETANEILENL